MIALAPDTHNPSKAEGYPTIPGTGRCVHLVIMRWQELNHDTTALKRELPRLTRDQIEAAIEYYAANRAEIDALIDLEREPLERRYAEFRKNAIAEIVRNPNIQGGAPTVRGTRVPVHTLVQCWRAVGEDVVAVERNYPHLTQRQIEVALEFYLANRREIDGYIDEEKQIAREWTGPRFKPSKR